jgi:hypothetical protein
VLFAVAVPKEEEAPAKRRSKVLDLPPSVMGACLLHHDLRGRVRARSSSTSPPTATASL